MGLEHIETGSFHIDFSQWMMTQILCYESSSISGTLTDGKVTWRPWDVGLWGLAVHPDEPKLGLQDANDADFVAAGCVGLFSSAAPFGF